MLKKAQIYALLSVLILYLFFIQRIYADSPATPDPGTENFANLIINEVSFKNSEHDWIEIYVVSSGSIMGLKVFDDNNFINVEDNINVEAGDYILIYFKADEDLIGYDGDTLVIQNTKSGLTGTTEQVALKNPNNEVIDLICWRNSSPTAGEIEDFNELIEDQWTYGNIESCINSDQVSNTNSIGRISNADTNSPDDWQIFNTPTPGETNILEEEEEEEEELPEIELPSLIFEFEEQEETECVTIIEEKNDNICKDNIYINEIFPNPSGKDTNNEWIELENKGNSKCNLEGWLIDDNEEGSKPYTLTINDEIIAGGYLLLPSWKTKINLNNSDDAVRLFYPDESLANEINYKDTYENKTFAKNADEFEWTEKITPLTENIFVNESEEEDNDDEKEDKEEKEPIIANGTLSDSLFINEILPNPEGSDKGNEWIELYNDSDENVNLGNWKLDTGENSKTQYIFQNKAVGPNEHLLINDSELKFSLKNSNGEVRLLNFNDDLIDLVEYEEVEQGQSYTKFSILKQNETEFSWEWTEDVTPGEQNPIKNKYEGEILEFDQLNSVLSLKIEESKENVILSVLNDGASNYDQIFVKGTKIAAITSENEEGVSFLDEYEIISQPDISETQEKPNYFLYILLSLIPITGGLYLLIKKFNILKIAPA